MIARIADAVSNHTRRKTGTRNGGEADLAIRISDLRIVFFTFCLFSFFCVSKKNRTRAKKALHNVPPQVNDNEDAADDDCLLCYGA